MAKRIRRITIRSLQKQRRAQVTAQYLFQIKNRTCMEDPKVRELMAMTLLNSPDPQMKAYADHCLIEDRKKTSMATLAVDHHLDLMKIADEFQRIKHAEGLIRIHARFPEVAGQIVEAAMDRTVACPAEGCDNGLIEIKPKTPVEFGKPVHRICPKCHGDGTIVILGNDKRLEYVLESVKLINQPSKNQQIMGVTVNVPGQNEKLEDLYGSVAPILEGRVTGQ